MGNPAQLPMEADMKCTKCEYYSFPLRRCKLGKINPPTIKGGVEAARIMGLDYICAYGEENTAKKGKIIDKLTKGE
jgi:hypothetical protein